MSSIISESDRDCVTLGRMRLVVYAICLIQRSCHQVEWYSGHAGIVLVPEDRTSHRDGSSGYTTRAESYRGCFVHFR